MESQALFKQYQPMICYYANKVANKWHVEADDVIEEGYTLFVLALRDYDAQKASFSTYLYHKLRKLDQYCIMHGGLIKVSRAKQKIRCVPIDGFDFCTYENFCKALEQQEIKRELSPEARKMLQYIVDKTWEVVGEKTNRCTFKMMMEKYVNDGWEICKVRKVWNELQTWWGKYYYVYY